MKETMVADLFLQEKEVMQAVNPRDFRVERFDSIQLGNTGTARLDSGKHEYILGPSWVGSRMTVGRTAESINFYSLDGILQKSFDRIFCNAPSVSYDLESILKGLYSKPNSWMNSPVRDAMEDNEFRKYIDSADNRTRRSILNLLSHNAEEFGFGISCVAMEEFFCKGRIPTKEDLSALSRVKDPTNGQLKIYFKEES